MRGLAVRRGESGLMTAVVSCEKKGEERDADEREKGNRREQSSTRAVMCDTSMSPSQLCAGWNGAQRCCRCGRLQLQRATWTAQADRATPSASTEARVHLLAVGRSDCYTDAAWKDICPAIVILAEAASASIPAWRVRREAARAVCSPQHLIAPLLTHP